MLNLRLQFLILAIFPAAILSAAAPTIDIGTATTANTPEDPLHPEALVKWTGTGHYYQAVAVPEGIDWYVADRWAWLRGGHLATIDSAETNFFVFNLVKDLKFWLVNKNSGNADGPWLGGRHIKGASVLADGWQWIEGDLPFTFTAWEPGAPRAKTNNEFCTYYHVKMDKGSDPILLPVWNDRNGTAKHHGFVAEYQYKPKLDVDGNPIIITERVTQLAANDAKAKLAKSPAPDQTAPREVQKLTTQQMAGIVFIEGSKGRATGFLSKVHEVEGVVTNLHVLGVMGDDLKITVTDLAGKEIKIQGAIGAVGEDILFLRLATPTGQPPVFTIAPDVLKTAKIGDDVVVVGNNRGTGVITQVSGQIDGFGPTRIEVDAQFQPGNSGSPVFDVTTQQVIGVATYVETFAANNPTDPATNKNGPTAPAEKRWFGYRLDSVTKWETIDLAKWQRQLKRVEDYRTVCLALNSCLQFQFGAAKTTDPRLRPILQGYEGRSDWVELAGKSSVVLTSRTVALFRDLYHDIRTYAEQGSQEFKAGDYYDYFHTCLYPGDNVTNLVKLRELEMKACDEIDTNLADYRAKLKD